MLTNSDDSEIVEEIKKILTRRPGLTVPQINDALVRTGRTDGIHLHHIAYLLVHAHGFTAKREHPDQDEQWYYAA